MKNKNYFCLFSEKDNTFYTGVGYYIDVFTSDARKALIFPTVGAVEGYLLRMKDMYNEANEVNPLVGLSIRPWNFEGEVE